MKSCSVKSKYAFAYVVFKNNIFFCNYFVGHPVLVNQLKVCIIHFNPDIVTTTFDSKFLYLFIFGIALVLQYLHCIFLNIRFDKSFRLARVS